MNIDKQANNYQAQSNRYDSMPYRRCGKSGILLPAISLGLWKNFGDVDDVNNARAMLLEAFDCGITHFDLANNYGPSPGSAEKTCGAILRNDLSRYRDELLISSKAGYDMWPGPYGNWGSRKFIIASCEQSLQRLGLDYVDIFYHHRPDPETPLEESMHALASLVQQGKALYVGLSNYRPERAAAAAQMLADLGTPCLIHQPRYNMRDRWITDHQENGQNLLAVADNAGFGLITFSPLAQGLLSDRYLAQLPEKSRAARQGGHLAEQAQSDQHQELLNGLSAIARQRQQSIVQLALAWNLRLPQTTSVLIGASSPEQIREAVATTENLTLSNEELQKIDALIDKTTGG